MFLSFCCLASVWAGGGRLLVGSKAFTPLIRSQDVTRDWACRQHDDYVNRTPRRVVQFLFSEAEQERSYQLRLRSRSASGYHVGRCALRKAETVERRTELQKGDALALATPQPCQRSVVVTLKKRRDGRHLGE
jgi:hypothetical protein